MSIQDRGTKKWTSIMMPEQKYMLDQMWKQQEYKQKPILDQQELEELNYLIHYAVFEGIPVDITYFKNHDTHKITASLRSIDSANRTVRLNDEDRTEMALDDIIHVSLY